MSSMIYDLNGIPVQIEYRRIKNINLYKTSGRGGACDCAERNTFWTD